MGKVRSHIDDDAAALAQWAGRKMRNHDPMSVRTKGVAQGKQLRDGGHMIGNGRVSMAGRNTVGIVEQEPHVIIYELADGRKFEMTVRAMKDDEPVPALREVGA